MRWQMAQVLVATGYWSPDVEFDIDDLQMVVKILNESRKQ